MNRYLAAVMCLVALLAATARLGVAQTPPPGTCVLTGVVQGPDGARLPGVVILITGGDGDVTQVVSGEQGAYRVSGLRAGRYRVRTRLQGFRGSETEFEVGQARLVTLDFRLSLDSLAETITVVGTAERGSLEATRIRESGARDVGEALSSLAGVWKIRRGAIANDIVVRGYQNDNVTVLIDGARLYGACPNNMDHTAFHVDFAEVDRIEIAKGPFDLKNQGSLGAAVNIVTKRPAEGWHANPQMSVGSYGYLNPVVTASYGTPAVAVLGGYSYRASDAYTDGSGRSFLQSSNYRPTALGRRAFDVNTAWAKLDAASRGVHAFHIGYTRQRAGAVLYPYLQMDAVYDNADRLNLGYHLKRALGPIHSLRGQAYLTRVQHSMTDEQRVSSIAMTREYSMATMAKTDTLGGKIEAAVRSGTVGVEVYRRGWDAQTQLAMMKYQSQASIPDVVVTSVGFYGEFTRRLGDRLQLELGGRLDRTGNEADPAKAATSLYRAYHGAAVTAATDTYPSGKVRLSYRLSPSFTVAAGAGRTVRVPDPQERFFGLRRMGTDWVGNPFLRPTANTGVDMNVAYRAGRVFVNGNVHRDVLTDAIGVYDQARVVSGAGIVNAAARSYRNVDATMSGAEIEAVLPVTDRLFIAGDVSAVRGRQQVAASAGINSVWLSEMPPARSRLAVRYERRGTRRSGFAEIETVHSARQDHVDTDLRETPTPAYTVTNARVGGTVGQLRLALGLSNLFNRTYVEHLSYQRDPFRIGWKVPEPGRNLYVNLSLVF